MSGILCPIPAIDLVCGPCVYAIRGSVENDHIWGTIDAGNSDFQRREPLKWVADGRSGRMLCKELLQKVLKRWNGRDWTVIYTKTEWWSPACHRTFIKNAWLIKIEPAAIFLNVGMRHVCVERVEGGWKLGDLLVNHMWVVLNAVYSGCPLKQPGAYPPNMYVCAPLLSLDQIWADVTHSPFLRVAETLATPVRFCGWALNDRGTFRFFFQRSGGLVHTNVLHSFPAWPQGSACYVFCNCWSWSVFPAFGGAEVNMLPPLWFCIMG